MTGGTRSILYIVRHAECMNNATRVLLAPDEDVLTDNGRKQAALLGEHLADERFTSASASDYSRTFQTAQIILHKSKHSSGLLIKAEERLRERNMGIYEGKHIKGLLELIMKHMKPGTAGGGVTELEIEGATPPEVMFQRVESYLDDVFKLVDGSESPQTVLAVTHGCLTLYLVHYLVRSTQKFRLQNTTEALLKLSPNTGYLKIAIEKNPAPGSARTLEFLAEYDSAHLKPLQKADILQKYTEEAPEAKIFSGCVHQ